MMHTLSSVIARSASDEAIQIGSARGILDCFADARNDDNKHCPAAVIPGRAEREPGNSHLTSRFRIGPLRGPSGTTEHTTGGPHEHPLQP
jgi:hypothetical protein